MDAEPKTSKVTDGEKRKRKSSSKNGDKKSRGKQRKKNVLSENDANEQQTTQEKEGGSPTRPSSPENCSICLGDLQNKSFTDSCFHMFCFVCLKEWSKVKAECPLCKQKFKNIIYNVKSYEKYDQYNLEEQNRSQQFEGDERRFRYRTTVTFERRFTFGSEHDYTQPIGRPSNRSTNLTTRSHWRRYREPATSDFRRRVYRNGMRAADVPDERLRVRDTTPQFFSRNPAQMHRLVPWLNRELNALLHNQPEHVEFLMDIVMGTIKRYPIDSEEFYQHVYPYIGRNTRHFMHEFACFAKSPYNMPTYDAQVSYQESTNTDNTLSTDDTDEDIDNQIIDIEEESDELRSAPVRRGASHPFSTLSGWSSLLRGYNDLFDTGMGSSSMRMPLSLSGWDSPTPGPSWDTGDVDYSGSNFPGGNVPVESNRASSPIDIGTSSDSDSDSTDSAESTNSDIVFVKIDKPWEERSPIMLSSSDSDDVERNISLDFQHKHYSKKKTMKKKKHKEHKKHSRENSKERNKHKKHKKNKSEGERNVNSKSKDSSCPSTSRVDSSEPTSSSKHRDRKRSAPSSDDKSSPRVEKHHKKHKKHKRDEEKNRSTHPAKLKSVIVRPSATVSSKDESSASLLPSKSTPELSVPCSQYAVEEGDQLYKKHSSGHKRSGKLTDIVPRLIGKKLIQFSPKVFEDNKTNTAGTMESKSDSLATTTAGKDIECSVADTRTTTEVPSKPGHMDKGSCEDQQASVTSSNFHHKDEDSILSLDNSRRCFKCNLLYIPELLDSNGICFTCKRKRACETATRSFSDAFLDLQVPRPGLPYNSNIHNVNTGNQMLSNEDQISLSSDEGSIDVCESDSDFCKIECYALTTEEMALRNLSTLESADMLNPQNHPPISGADVNSLSNALDDWPNRVHRTEINYLPKSPKLTSDSRIGLPSSSSEADKVDLTSNSLPLNQDPRDKDDNNQLIGNLNGDNGQDGHLPELCPISRPINTKNGHDLPRNTNDSCGELPHIEVTKASNDSHQFPKIFGNSDTVPSKISSNNIGFPSILDTMAEPILDVDNDETNITTLSSDEDSLIDVENESDDCEITHYTESMNFDDKERNSPISMLNNNLGAEEEISTDFDNESSTKTVNSTEAFGLTSCQSYPSTPSKAVTSSCDMGPHSSWMLDSNNPPLGPWAGLMAPQNFMGDSTTSSLQFNRNPDDDDISGDEHDVDEGMTVDKSQTLSELNSEQGTLHMREDKDTSGTDSSEDEECEETSQLPASLGEKLEGLTDFSKDVLQTMKRDNRLTFHNILSQAKPRPSETDSDSNQFIQSQTKNSNSDSDCNKFVQSQAKPSTSKTDYDSNQFFPSCVNPNTSDTCFSTRADSLSCNSTCGSSTPNATVSSVTDVTVTDSGFDCLIRNCDENDNSNDCSEIEIENLDNMTSCNQDITDKAPDFANLNSPASVPMETNIGTFENEACSTDQLNNMSIALFPSEESFIGLESGGNRAVEADNLDDTSNTTSKVMDCDYDKNETGITAMDNQSDDENNEDNVIGHSNYSSDSDDNLQDVTINSDINTSTMPTVEYRVDILHSDQDLENIFQNDT